MSKRQIKRLALRQLLLLAFAVMAFASYFSVSHAGHAKAAVVPFTVAFVRLDTLTAVQPTGGRVCVKPSSTNASQTIASIKVTFPTTSGTDYVVNSTAANWTVTTSNLDAGQTAMPTIATANNVTGKAVTFPLGTPQVLSASNLYCFNFAAASTLTTSSAGAAETTQGTVASQIAGPTIEDQTTYSESIISDNTVVVTATVPPSFTFVLSGNTDSFNAPGLSTGSVNTSNGNRTITITTNAASGWIIWAQDLNNVSGKGALHSTTASYNITGTGTICTPAIFTAGAENYGLAATINTDAAGGGTVAVNYCFNGTTSNFAGTLDPTRFQVVATANGTANGDIINVKELATIAGQTPAASDYTDTISFVGAGQF